MNKYPKLTLLLCSFALAYGLFQIGVFDWIGHAFHGHGYISMFLAGLLFSFGFTTPFAIALFIQMAPEVDPIIAAPIAAMGAVASDFIIFEILRVSTFHDEVHRLRRCKPILWLRALIHHEDMPEKIRRAILWSCAGFIIASPLPDEFGVTLLSGLSDMRPRDFAIVSFLCNAVGIFLLLLGAKAVA